VNRLASVPEDRGVKGAHVEGQIGQTECDPKRDAYNEPEAIE
jgi:hypothetical protein